MAAAPVTDPARDESTTANWFAMEFSGKSLSVRLNPDLVDRLGREVLDSFKSLSKRGSEVGGILLGEFGADPRTVFVEDFELVPCGYTRSPLYLLSDVEKRRMEAAIRARKNKGERLTPVGFFRSNTRSVLAPDEEDVSLVASHFTAPDSVVLLIKPFSMKPCLASFFAWPNGPGESPPDSIQFPFKRSELLAKRGPAPALRRVEPPVTAPAPANEESQPPVAAVTADAPAPPPAPAVSGSKEPSVEAPPPPPTPEIAVRVSPAPAATAAESLPPAEPVVSSAPAPASLAAPAKSGHGAAAESVAVGVTVPAPPPAVPEAVEPVNPAPPTLAPAVPAEGRAEAPAAVVPEARSGSRLLLWLQFLALGLFLFMVGAYVQYRMEARHPNWKPGAASASSLSLKAERSGGQLYLNWDRNAAEVRGAQKASLFITDGDQTQVVPLTANELRTGGFVYTPATGDVGFRIELTSLADGRIVSESIRSVLGRPSPLGALALPAAPASDPAAAQEGGATNPPPEPAATTQPPAKEQDQPAQAAPAPESSTP
jgi:hypothetical protein